MTSIVHIGSENLLERRIYNHWSTVYTLDCKLVRVWEIWVLQFYKYYMCKTGSSILHDFIVW